MLEMNRSRCSRWNTYFLYFLVYSFVGWLYELGVFALEFHEGLVNRGFLFGPYLPVYGAGGLIVLYLLGKRRKQRLMVGKVNVAPLVFFLCVVVVTTIVELVTSYLMELVIGTWLWDYTMDIPNFQGRIALKSSLRFGLIGIAGLYILQPMMEKTFEGLEKRFPRGYAAVSYLLFAVFAIDCIARCFLGSNYIMP